MQWQAHCPQTDFSIPKTTGVWTKHPEPSLNRRWHPWSFAIRFATSKVESVPTVASPLGPPWGNERLCNSTKLRGNACQIKSLSWQEIQQKCSPQTIYHPYLPYSFWTTRWIDIDTYQYFHMFGPPIPYYIYIYIYLPIYLSTYLSI